MKTTNDDEAPGEDLTEAATGEYPVMKEGDPPPAEQLNGKHHAVQVEGEKAAFWLHHLETEVSRLHAKWHSIDGEFKQREARIAELRDEVKARESVVEKLSADLRSGADALKAADERIAGKDVEIGGLAEQVKERERKLGEVAATLGEAEARHRTLENNLKATQSEVARLDAAVKQERDTAAGVGKLNEELLAEQRQLQSKLQDLETYINGRHHSWSELNSQLADYKDALLGMERTVKARDQAVARFDEEKRQLAARILDLERQCSELNGRRKEREVQYDDLQRKLSEHFEAMEQLKAEHATRAKEAEQALAKAVNGQKHIESLERGITRRDETLTALGTELEQQKSAVEELTGAKDKLTKRADELEKTLQERTQQAQALREELRTSHEQLQTIKDQFADQGAQLSSTRALADQKTQLSEQLGRDLRVLEKDAADVRAELARLEEHAAELGQLRSEALAECDRLKAELSAQQELVSSLETELRAKQATADLLERNVGRITDLGASLAALDRQMDGADDNAIVSAVDLRFIETVAADDRKLGAAQELLSLDALIGEESDDHRDLVDVGQPVVNRHSDSHRKLVALLGAEGVDYPLVKREMTIGRGHGSDIRIASHFISRIHAKVSTSGIGTIIEDAGSKNGILVNSERVTKKVLRDGDIVSLGGELSLRYVDATP